MKTIKIAVIFAAALLSGCAEELSALDTAFGEVAGQYTAVDRVTGERVVNQYDRKQQIAEADKEMRSFISEVVNRGGKINAAADANQYRRLLRIFRRVHAVSHFRNENWTPVLLGSNEWNAFVNGGTYVFVHWGLMNDLSDDDELAVVIAHEIAHVAANHRFEQDSHKQIANLLGSKSADREHWDAAFTYKQEEEADKIGILYMALAGYDPHAAARVWERKFAERGDGNILIRTHPESSSRMQKARSVARQVNQYYSAGTRNVNFASLLRKNVLWNSEKSDIAVGKGGGFLSVLEGVASGLTQHNEAKTEELRQQQQWQKNNPPVIEWTISDACNDGQRNKYRFFAKQNNSTVGAWPDYGKVYWTSGSDAAVSALSCEANYNKICYGGESANGATYWGAGIDGRRGCSGCCWTCPEYGKAEASINMTCR